MQVENAGGRSGYSQRSGGGVYGKAQKTQEGMLPA